MKGLHTGILLLSWLLAAPAARAIVLFGGDAPAYLQAPANGAPWRYAAKVADPEGSGVYLGKRFVLTANHVSKLDPVVIDGRTFSVDTSFKPRQINGEDLKIFRINGDPGLPNLPIIGANNREFAKRCVVIGWGLGRGESVAKKGWTWTTPRVQRWGTNTTQATVVKRPDGPRLATAFNHGIAANEMSLANTDSGCPLFINFNGVWKLAAIGVDVDDNAAYFDRNLSKAGRQPTRSYYVRVRPHRAAILNILNNASP